MAEINRVIPVKAINPVEIDITGFFFKNINRSAIVSDDLAFCIVVSRSPSTANARPQPAKTFTRDYFCNTLMQQRLRVGHALSLADLRVRGKGRWPESSEAGRRELQAAGDAMRHFAAKMLLGPVRFEACDGETACTLRCD